MPKFVGVIGFVIAALVSLGPPAGPASADSISHPGISHTGAIDVINPPASVRQGALESDTVMRVFAERLQFTLPSNATVDFTAPGLYDALTDLPATPPVIAAGTKVNSYYIHADKVGTAGSATYDGTITFDAKILGVIVRGSTHVASQGTLGAPGTLYETFGGPWDLGPCAAIGPDCVELTSSRQTLILHATVFPHVDQIRVLTEAFVVVGIDVKPGSFPNSINLGSNGTVPVAILSTANFDATKVDPSTVTLGGAAVTLKGKGTAMASSEDVNGDGLPDLVVHVSTEAFQLSEADTEAVLEGRTFDGVHIRGTDTVRVVP